MKSLNRISFLIIIPLMLMACTEVSEQTAESNSENTAPLQHTVYFYLNEDVSPEQAEEFENGLVELMQIPDIYKYEIGIPAATDERDVTDHSFAYSIYTWFQTMEDYKAYDVHPDHQAFIDRYSSLWENVRVYDSELIQQ